MRQIKVVFIDFKSTTSLVLFEEQYSNLLNDSKRYGFDLKDVKRCRRTKISVVDFPQFEFNG